MRVRANTGPLFSKEFQQASCAGDRRLDVDAMMRAATAPSRLRRAVVLSALISFAVGVAVGWFVHAGGA